MIIQFPQKPDSAIRSSAPDISTRNAYGRLSSAVGEMQENFDTQQSDVETFRRELRTLGDSLISTAQNFRRYRARLKKIDMSRLGRKSRRLAALMASCEVPDGAGGD